jgi:hypothetical protein
MTELDTSRIGENENRRVECRFLHGTVGYNGSRGTTAANCTHLHFSKTHAMRCGVHHDNAIARAPSAAQGKK